jgi:predicted transposase/invertase (TIGR01784 family)
MCSEFHSEYQLLEVTRHTPLTDKQVLHYFELPKVPKTMSSCDEVILWLRLFGAETEEDLKQIEDLEVQVMKQAIGAYRHVSATEEFKEIERMRSRARHNEASALGHARREGEKIGKEVGERAKAIDIAKNALQMNMPFADIVKLTGLELAEVEIIAKDTKDADTKQ